MGAADSPDGPDRGDATVEDDTIPHSNETDTIPHSDETDALDLMGSITAVSRVIFSDLLTIVWVSMLFALLSLPLLTLGAAMLAAVETLTTVITGEGRGGPTTERERIRVFLGSFRGHLSHGVPYSVVTVVVVATMVFYVLTASADETGLLFLGALMGLYAIVICFAWLLRAGSITIRSTEPVGFVDAAREAAYQAFSYPWYAAIQLITVGVILLVAFVVPPAYVLLVPGLLVVLEVVTFEETEGQGAMTVVRAYRGEFEE
jgi:hypothetical protein